MWTHRHVLYQFFEKHVLYKRTRICALISPHLVVLAQPDAGRKSKGNGSMVCWELANAKEGVSPKQQGASWLAQW